MGANKNKSENKNADSNFGIGAGVGVDSSVTDINKDEYRDPCANASISAGCINVDKNRNIDDSFGNIVM